MTDYLVRLSQHSPGALASGWVPADEVAVTGSISCRPFAPDIHAARVHAEGPDRIILPEPFSVRLVAGECTLPLRPTDAWWCWEVREQTKGGRIRHLSVADSALVLDYAKDAVDVDPTTLAPAASAVPAWTAAVDAVQLSAGAAAQSASDANVSAGAAAGSAGAAAQSASDANASALAALGTVSALNSMVANGGFPTDVASWSALSSTNTFDTATFGYGVLKNASTLAGGAGAYQYVAADKTHTFYLQLKFYNSNAGTVSVRLTQDNTSTTIYQSDPIATQGAWQTFSLLITPAMLTATSTGFRVYIRQGETQPTTIYVDSVMLFDMTAAWGASSEPTATEMADLIGTTFYQQVPTSVLAYWGSRRAKVANAAAVTAAQSTVLNKLTNGGATLGTTGWTASSAVNTADSTTFGFPVIKNVASVGGGAGTYQYIACDVTHTFYVSARLYNSNAAGVMVRITRDNTATTLYSSTNHTATGPWVSESFLVTPTTLATASTGFRVYIRQGESSASIVYADDMLVVDLTAAFGAGNEPALVDCQILFATYFEDKAASANVLGWALTKLPAATRIVYERDVMDAACAVHTSPGSYVAPKTAYADLYGMYDALVTAYPDYVTRTTLCTEESGLPVYRYDFTPPTATGTGGLPPSKILVVGGVHGSEYEAQTMLARMFGEVCADWKTSEVYRSLRWHVGFTVIPCLNPWGLNNAARKNYRGVDLNRNFPTGWTANGDTGSDYYPGTAALSEVASAALYAIMDDGYLFTADCHNGGVVSDGYIMQAIVKDTTGSVLGYANELAAFMPSKMRRDFSFVSQSNSAYGQVKNFAAAACDGQTFGSMTSPGLLIENSFGWGTVPTGTVTDMQKYQVESLACAMYGAWRAYR